MAILATRELTETQPLPILIQQRTHLQPAAPWEQLVLRLGFITTGVVLLHWAMLAWSRGNVYVAHESVFIVMGEYVTAFTLLGIGLIAANRAWLRRLAILIPIAVVCGMMANSYIEITIMNPGYGTDTLAFSHEAADRLLSGQNPYSVHGVQALDAAAKRFGVPTEHITFRTDGTPINNLMSWPAGSFLAFVVPSALGVTDMRWVVAVFEVAVFALLWWRAPDQLRPLMFVPLIGDPYLAISLTTGGADDMLWVFLIVACAVALKSRRDTVAALLFGLAAGTKQQPWVLAPFLMIWLWYAYADEPIIVRVRALGRFCGWATAGFVALNGPFIVWNWHDWLRGTIFPLQDNLIPWGSGLSMLTQTGMADLSKSFYSLATFGVWGLLTLIYALHFRSVKHVMWIFPAIVMWFSYRSLHTYFIFWIPLVLVGLFFWWEEQNAAVEPSTSW